MTLQARVLTLKGGGNTFSIYEIFPKIIELWDLNMEGMSTSKKK